MNTLKKYEKSLPLVVYSLEIVSGAVFICTLAYFYCLLGLFIYQVINSFLLKKLLAIQTTVCESIFRYAVLIVLAVGFGCAIIGFALPVFFIIPYTIINTIIPILLIFHLFITLMDLKTIVCKPKVSRMSHH